MKKRLLIIWILAIFLQAGLSASGDGFLMKRTTEPAYSAKNPGLEISHRGGPQSYPGSGIFLNVSPVYSRIYNPDFYDDTNWKTEGGIGFNLDAGYFFRLQRYVGIGFGLGASNFQTQAVLDGFHQSFPAVDIDGDEVEQMVDVYGITQDTRLFYLDIPVFIELGNPNTHSVNFYVRLGAKFSFPMSYDFSSSGETTINGHYPQYFVTLEEIPELGYESHKSVVILNDTEIKPVNISLLLSAGVTFPLSDYFILKAGANLVYGISEISEEKLSARDVSYFLGNCNSLLMSPSGKTTTQSAGLEVGIIYIFKSKF